MSASLKARLDRLERQQESRPKIGLVFGIRNAEDADVIAFEGNGVVTLRGDNEPIAELRERAFRTTGAIVLTARYRADALERLAEREIEHPATSAAREPEIEPVTLPSAVDAYWERAGIGISREAWRRFRRDGDTSFD